ncbi:MAG: hypothetical protein JSS91_13950 [Bacteroidetes bacterium]|nr:hypothetical protein [Bacteroidota bacterium]
MKKIIQITLSAVLFISIIYNSANAGQTGNKDYKTEQITNDAGIPVNLVYCMYQDSRGFIWFGTMFGLVRYDGLNYKTYRHDPGDRNSLSNDDIVSVFEDRDGYLWLGSYNGGLNRYDRSSGIFTRYIHIPGNESSIGSNTIWSIVQDEDGVIWFATEGGGLSKFEKNKFTSYRNNTSDIRSISSDNVRALVKDHDGNIWAGTSDKGLNKLDRKTGEFTVYMNDTSDESTVSSNSIVSLLCDSYGEIWVGTADRGLNKFEKKPGTFKRYMNIPEDPESISGNSVLSLSEISPGILAAGTGNGLNSFSVTSEKFSKLNLYPGNTDSRQIIISLLKDYSGVIWISNYQNGLIKLIYNNNKFVNFFENKNVLCFYNDLSGNVWIGTSSGLLKTDRDFNIIETFKKEKGNSGSISSDFINTIAGDVEGNIYIGTVSGMNILPVKNNKNSFIRFYSDPDDPGSLSNNNIRKIYADRSGKIWVGTDMGLNLFIPSENNFVRYIHSDKDNESLSENTILSAYEDKHGNMWFGTYSGLNKLDRNSGKFRHYRHDPDDPKTISNNYVFSFCEDASGNLWIGTGGGLNRFDPLSDSFLYLNEKNGMENSVVASLIYDGLGNLWLGTMRGIERFNISENEFCNFNLSDGLLSSVFNYSAVMNYNNGNIYFGGTNGISGLDPVNLKLSNYSPEVFLTDIKGYNGNSSFSKDISALKGIDLSYSDNLINIGFSSSDYVNPSKVKFSYTLEGFDENWILADYNRNAVYTNLDPGDYVFKVRGTNSDGVGNEKISEIKIHISPPFWKTWWFYSLMLSLIIVSVVIVQNVRIKNKLSRLLEIEKARESEREKVRQQASRDYHDELGHKLTRISLYSRRVNKKLQTFTSGISEDLKSIVDTSNSLQSGAKDLIWTMNPQEDSLFDFAVRLKDFGNELFERSGMEFHAGEIDTELKQIRLSMNCKRHLIYIFKEGMNNILKYSECKNVKLTIRLYGEDVTIILEDDGIGFDPENCQKGYGLKNIFSRAAQINLNVNMNSEPGKGSKLTLTAGIQNLISVYSDKRS